MWINSQITLLFVMLTFVCDFIILSFFTTILSYSQLHKNVKKSSVAIAIVHHQTHIRKCYLGIPLNSPLYLCISLLIWRSWFWFEMVKHRNLGCLELKDEFLYPTPLLPSLRSSNWSYESINKYCMLSIC